MSTKPNTLQTSGSVEHQKTKTDNAQQCHGLALIGTAAHLQVDRTPYRTALYKEAATVHSCSAQQLGASQHKTSTASSKLPRTRSSLNITALRPDVAIPANQAAPARPAVASAEFISRLTAELSCSTVLQTARGKLLPCKSWYNIPRVSTINLLLPVNALAQHRPPASKAASVAQPAQAHAHSLRAHGTDGTVHCQILLQPPSSSSNAAAACGGTAAMPAVTAAAVAAATCKLQSDLCDRFHASLLNPVAKVQLPRYNGCQTVTLPDSVPLPSQHQLEQLRHAEHMARLQQLAAPAKASHDLVSIDAAAAAGNGSPASGSFVIELSKHGCREGGPNGAIAARSPASCIPTNCSGCASPTDTEPPHPPMIAAYFKSIDLASDSSISSNAMEDAVPVPTCMTGSGSGFGEMSSIAAELAQLLGSDSSHGRPSCSLVREDTCKISHRSSLQCTPLPPACDAANSLQDRLLLPCMEETTAGEHAHSGSSSSNGNRSSRQISVGPAERRQQQQERSNINPASAAPCCPCKEPQVKPAPLLGLPDAVSDLSSSPQGSLAVTGLSSHFNNRSLPVGHSVTGTEARPVLAVMPDLFGALPVVHSTRIGRGQAGGNSSIKSNSTSYMVSAAVAAGADEIGGVVDRVLALVPQLPGPGISLCPWRQNPAVAQ